MTTSFHFYLKNRPKQNGSFPIYHRITKNRRHKYLSTGISVKEKEWNANEERVRRNNPNYKTLNETLELIERDARKVQTDLNKTGSATAKTISERLKMTQNAEFFYIADELYHELVEEKKYQVYKKLKVVLKKLEHFEVERNLPLARIDSEYLLKFERFLRLEYGNSDTTINKNFQLIKKVIDKALKKRLLANDPFNDYKVPSESKRTSKTKLTIEQIHAIEALDLIEGSLEWDARNAFLFSFYSGGIRFGDLCCLTWDNIIDEKLVYTMNKNDKSLSMELTKNQWEILLRMNDSSKYIFPFLNESKDYSDPIILRRDIGSKNAQLNGKKNKGNQTGLKKIAILAGIEENISMHVARHSFAQFAIDRGISLYDLSASLKHTGLKSTQQYLKSLSEDSVNRTMKKLFE
tara:strand:+ start:217 stop:1437 length:1221 start_codon:yes stop_codon:yes gene_type:complete